MACNCNSNPCGCNSGITFPGLTGAAGSNGIFGGYSGEWKFDDTTSAGPSSTYLRLNNATPASVTEIYINDTNIDSIDYGAFLDSFDNSANFGYIRLFKEYDSSTFWAGRITALTDNTSYFTLTVTHIVSNGTFTDEDNIVVSFAESGEDGANGTGDASIIDTVFDVTVNPNTSASQITSISIPADTLATDEDGLEFSIVMARASASNSDVYNIALGNQGWTTDANEKFVNINAQSTGWNYLHIIGRVHREDSSTAHCETEIMVSASESATEDPTPVNNLFIGHHDISIDWTQINLFTINNEDITNCVTYIRSFSVKKIEKV